MHKQYQMRNGVSDCHSGWQPFKSFRTLMGKKTMTQFPTHFWCVCLCSVCRVITAVVYSTIDSNSIRFEKKMYILRWKSAKHHVINGKQQSQQQQTAELQYQSSSSYTRSSVCHENIIYLFHVCVCARSRVCGYGIKRILESNGECIWHFSRHHAVQHV